MTTPADYEALALKVVPKGYERSRSALRFEIAKAVAAEVDKALLRQRSEQFPELADLESAVRKRSAELDKAEADIAKREAAVKSQVEATLKKRIAELDKLEADCTRRVSALTFAEARLAAVLAAVVAWDRYCKGHGAVDENGTCLNALVTACAEFTKKNPPKEKK